jgi:putative selenium metabolism hydrolase
MIGTLSPRDVASLTTFLQDLVRIPSPSTQEGAVAARLAEEMRGVGIHDVWVDRIGNVVGRIGAGSGKKLLYNGHMDTVGVSDTASWRHDPFGGEIESGLLYGRGAVDMKGALAAMVYAVRLLLEARVLLQGDLYLAGVVQEEPCEGLAMRILVEEEGLRPDWVVLGEPSDLQVRRGHPGRLEIEVAVHGVAAHASAPQRGANAIYRAARIITGLERLAQDRPASQGTLAVTQVESTAGSRNAVPDRCTFIIDRRLALGEVEPEALAAVAAEIARSSYPADVTVTEQHTTSYTGYQATQRSYFPSWSLAEDHPLVRAMAGAAARALGRVPEIGLWNFATDGVYTMGTAGIPTVGFGPGEEQYAHKADECIVLADVAAAAGVYAQLAVDLLGGE